MITARSFVARATALAVVWWIFTEGDGLWYYGIPLVIVATLLSLRTSPPTRRRRHPLGLRARAAAGVVWWFLRYSVTGGIDVARRVLRRRVDIDPVDDHIPVALVSPVGRVLLADLGSLTPGSLSVDLTNDGLDLHLLHRDMPVRRQLAELEQLLRILLDPPRTGPQEDAR